MPKRGDTATPQKQIDRFIKRHLAGEAVGDLTAELGVSKATGYLWVSKYKQQVLATSKVANMTPAAIDKMDKRELVAEVQALRAKINDVQTKLFEMMVKHKEL